MAGFLGTRATLMLDVVFLAMFLVLPVLGWSIWQVRAHKNYLLHKRMQLALAAVLLATVVLFEIDIRIHGWRHLAEPSPYFGSSGGTPWVGYALGIHLMFAVSTFFLWIVVTYRALRNFADPPQPGPHSAEHRRWAWIAAIDMMMTALTGWIFYWLAFVAT